jgi:large subunit ribosomal protein L3
MTIGLLGKKCGMTRIYTEDGTSIPVTVVEVLPNRITQIKTEENDGYSAIQVTVGTRKRTHITKAEAGHFAKANVEPGTRLKEFCVTAKQLEGLTVGSELKADLFKEGQFVDVSGLSKGKGFAGVIKRYHFSSQDETHGNSLTTRAPGSIGQRQSPGKVFKGKRMAGHMGNKKTSVMSQKIVRIDLEKNLVMIRGTVPGAPSTDVIIIPAVKKQHEKEKSA